MNRTRAIVVDPSAPGRLALKQVAMPQPATNEVLVGVTGLATGPARATWYCDSRG